MNIREHIIEHIRSGNFEIVKFLIETNDYPNYKFFKKDQIIDFIIISDVFSCSSI